MSSLWRGVDHRQREPGDFRADHVGIRHDGYGCQRHGYSHAEWRHQRHQLCRHRIDPGGQRHLVPRRRQRYDGETMVCSGTLCVTNPNALPDGTTLIVGDDATSIFSGSAAAAMAVPAAQSGGNPSTRARYAGTTDLRHVDLVPVPFVRFGHNMWRSTAACSPGGAR